MKALSLILVFLACSACARLELKPTPCFIYTVDAAVCTPPEGPSFDIPTNKMIGYTAFSAKDTADLKMFLKKLIAELDKRSISGNHLILRDEL